MFSQKVIRLNKRVKMVITQVDEKFTQAFHKYNIFYSIIILRA